MLVPFLLMILSWLLSLRIHRLSITGSNIVDIISTSSCKTVRMALEAAPIQIQQTQIFRRGTCEPLSSLKCSPLNDACLPNVSKGTAFSKLPDFKFNDKGEVLTRPGSVDSDTKSVSLSTIQIQNGASSASCRCNFKKPAKSVSRKTNRSNGRIEKKTAEEFIAEQEQGVIGGDRTVHKVIDCANESKKSASSSVSNELPEESFAGTKVCNYDGHSKPASTANLGITERNDGTGDSNILNQSKIQDENVGSHSQNVNLSEADTKERNNLKWRKQRKAFGRCGAYRDKNPNHNHTISDAGLLTTTSSGKPDPSVGSASSAASLKSYSEPGDIVPGTESCSGRSSDLVDPNKDPQSSQTSTSSEQMSNSQLNPISTWRRKKNNGKKRRVQNPGMGLHRLQEGSISSQKEQLQGKLPHARNGTRKDPTFADAVHPHWIQVPRARSVEHGALHTACGSEKKVPPVVDFRVSHKLLPQNKSFIYRTGPKQWIPVCRNEAKMKITASPSTEGKYVNNTNPPHKCKDCSHLECSILSPPITTTCSLSENIIPVVKESPKSKSMKPKLQNELSPMEELCGEPTKQLHVGSPSSEEAYNSSYRLQLAAEFVHQATGYSLAEFERLLYVATPTIDSPSMHQTSDNSSDEQHCGPSRHWMPSITLGAIWKWYEEIGNYGLKVSFKDPQDPNGFLSNQVLFHAHFVPSLSAIQLFGHHHLSASFAEGNKIPVNYRVEAPGHLSAFESFFLTAPKESTGQSLEDETVNVKENCGARASEEHFKCSRTHVGHAGCTLPTFLGDAEPLFEFFESEQPHLRMPLYNKVMELSTAGVSSSQGFGDPSILISKELSDLHPCSWFSVAWYPIYRIPEGKLRAAFLTYHSLGYVVHRNDAKDVLNKNKSCLSFPVIGLQSYNAQEKIWFSNKVEVSSVLKESASLLLKERRRMLEENASALARGIVRKGNMKITNRHHDFEYFISRKF